MTSTAFTERVGAPRTEIRPSSMTRSTGSASSTSAACSSSFRRRPRPAIEAALPTITAERLPAVSRAQPTTRVSPATTCTRSRGQPRRSANTCAAIVR